MRLKILLLNNVRLRKSLFILFVFFQFIDSHATNPTPDVFIYRNQEYRLYQYPLDDYFDLINLNYDEEKKAEFGDFTFCPYFGLDRGYVATWEITNKGLYLQSVSSTCTPQFIFTDSLINAIKKEKKPIALCNYLESIKGQLLDWDEITDTIHQLIGQNYTWSQKQEAMGKWQLDQSAPLRKIFPAEYFDKHGLLAFWFEGEIEFKAGQPYFDEWMPAFYDPHTHKKICAFENGKLSNKKRMATIYNAPKTYNIYAGGHLQTIIHDTFLPDDIFSLSINENDLDTFKTEHLTLTFFSDWKEDVTKQIDTIGLDFQMKKLKLQNPSYTFKAIKTSHHDQTKMKWTIGKSTAGPCFILEAQNDTRFAQIVLLANAQHPKLFKKTIKNLIQHTELYTYARR